MARIYPFRTLRYARRIPIGKVVTQPYDKISKEMQERYYASHPNNIVRLVYGKSDPNDSPSDNVYVRAAALLNDWRKSRVFEQIRKPGFFVYFQRFIVPGSNE